MKMVDRDGSPVGQRSESAWTMDGHCVRNFTPAAGVDLALEQVVYVEGDNLGNKTLMLLGYRASANSLGD